MTCTCDRILKYFFVSSYPMQLIRSITLLWIMALIIIPVQLFCLAHPLGHEHEHHVAGELTPCQKKAISTDICLWPPMDCQRVTIDADNYQEPQKIKIKPVNDVATAVVIPVSGNAISGSQQFIRTPDPRCNSGPPLADHLLRAPPLA